MKQSTAVSHLRAMMTAVQRVRSINAENGMVSIDDPLSAMMWPYVYDPQKAILPTLSKLLDGVDETGKLAPLDYYNLIVIATQLEPLIGVSASIYAGVDFPQTPDMNWVKGWDAE